LHAVSVRPRVCMPNWYVTWLVRFTPQTPASPGKRPRTDTATPGGRCDISATSLPYPTLPYPTLPYPTLPYPTLPYPTLSILPAAWLLTPSPPLTAQQRGSCVQCERRGNTHCGAKADFNQWGRPGATAAAPVIQRGAGGMA
jgi:hypothetical protein